MPLGPGTPAGRSLCCHPVPANGAAKRSTLSSLLGRPLPADSSGLIGIDLRLPTFSQSRKRAAASYSEAAADGRCDGDIPTRLGAPDLSSVLREAPEREPRDQIGQPLDERLIDLQIERRLCELLAIAQKNAALA